MVNIKLILNVIAIPFGLVSTSLIFARNSRNVSNILVGVISFLGCVAAVLFSLLKEIYYPIDENLAVIFAKLTFLSVFSMSIPALSFSIFFWNAKYRRLPWFLHLLSGIPTLALSLWLFLDYDSLQIVSTDFGTNSVTKLDFAITSFVVMFAVFLLLIVEFHIMAKRASNFPKLNRRMNAISIIFAFGLIFGILSLFIFQVVFPNVVQPIAIIVIFSAIALTYTFSSTISKPSSKLWHGCPKFLKENGDFYCINNDEGETESVKLIDLGSIIERIQIDTEFLKTGENNCANIVFSNNKGEVCCLTTNKPIYVLGEKVSREEMELARDMEILKGNELCAECLHKIIAYRKEHKEKSDAEIKMFFLGIRAEDFFGIA